MPQNRAATTALAQTGSIITSAPRCGVYAAALIPVKPDAQWKK